LASEVVGRAVPETVAPQSSSLVNGRYENLIQGGGSQEFETVLTRKDGSAVEVSITMSPINDARGKVVAYSTLSHDVSERNRAERALVARSEELTRSNAELEQFAYVASHDLQEPLRMVASYVELIQRRYKGRLDSDADEFIHFAVDGATRMKGLINDLLNYSRAGRGRPLQPVRLGEVVQRALTNLALAIEETGAAVACDAMPVVTGDESQLTELMQNLVANAIKFRGEKPPAIRIGAVRSGAAWLVSVRDNGIGISSEYSDRIFVMFQRLHGPTEYPGTGIGLAICKRIVERHGGRIWVESEPGNGANFKFTLAATAEDQPSEYLQQG
ncbi:MAG: PAS domain-containing sensor histidine kinase, partial [Candidatus Binataceae bacterium]